MKLINLIMKRMAIILIAILSLWSVLFYLSLKNGIYRIVDSGLQNFANDRISLFLVSDKGQNLAVQDSSGSYSYAVNPIPESYAQANNGTVFKSEREKKAAGNSLWSRSIRVIFQDGQGQYFQLTAWVPTLAQKQLQNSIARWIAILYFILLCSILWLNYRVVEKNMKPLYRLLRWIDGFDIQETPPPLDNPTRITEFQHLNQAVSEQFGRSAGLYVQQKDFVDNAAHELQTPLAVSLNHIEQLLQRPDLNEEQMQEILKVQGTLRRLSRLQKDMLHLSRIENGAYQGREKVDFGQYFRQAAEDLDEIFAGKHIDCQIEEVAPLQVLAHPALCELLVANLLRNAFLHTPPEGRFLVRWDSRGFSIRNTGNKALDKDHIFQRFYKDSRTSSSSGLGLSICQAICHQYHWPLQYGFEEGSHCFSLRVFPQPES